MRGLDPRIHPLRRVSFEEGWLAGSSAAMTLRCLVQSRLCGRHEECRKPRPGQEGGLSMSVDLASAVEDFWAARGRGEYFPLAYADRLELDEAYRIQLALIERRVAAGERQIGWKVGLTAKPIQQQFGFHEPVFACVLETQPSGHTFSSTELINPGFETELCIRLRRGLEGVASLEQVRAAVDA